MAENISGEYEEIICPDCGNVVITLFKPSRITRGYMECSRCGRFIYIMENHVLLSKRRQKAC